MFLYKAMQMNFANRGTTDFPPVERMTPSYFNLLAFSFASCTIFTSEVLIFYISVLQIPFELVTTSYWFSH